MLFDVAKHDRKVSGLSLWIWEVRSIHVKQNVYLETCEATFGDIYIASE